jgi:hypothetical protein
MNMESKYIENPTLKIISEIENFKNQKENLKYRADEFLVYDLCKSIARMMVLIGIDFASMSFDKKFGFVDSILKFVDPEIVHEGVLTFHENCDHYKL